MTGSEDVDEPIATGPAARGEPCTRHQVFGPAGGGIRLGLGLAALLTLMVLTITLARLDLRLATLASLNDESARGAHEIAAADDRLTRRLRQLTALADSSHRTLDQTRSLRPVLVNLTGSINQAAAAVATGRTGGERTVEQLARIRQLLAGLATAAQGLHRSTETLGQHGTELLTVLGGITDDLRGGVEAARRIDTVLPPPSTGAR